MFHCTSFQKEGNSKANAYMKNRVLDAADIFTATVTVGSLGFKLQAGPVSLGLHGQAIPQILLLPVYAATPIPTNFSPTGVVPSPEWGLKDGVIGTTSVTDLTLITTIKSRDKHNYKTRDLIRDRKKDRLTQDSPLTPYTEPMHAHQYTNIELSLGMFIGIRVGFNPGEFLDFILGFAGIDIYKDDIFKEQIYTKENIGEFLVAAAHANRTKDIETLLSKGADIDSRDHDGETALIRAAMMNHPEAAEFLIEKGADVNAADRNNKTPLMYASKHERSSRIIFQLLHNGARVNDQNDYGQTALMEAVKNGRTETARILLENNADIHLKNKSGEAAYMLARDKEIKILFLKKGIPYDINQKNEFENTELMNAIQDDDLNYTQLLLKNAANANVNIQSKYGETALMIAARKKDIAFLKLLIQHGAKVNIKDKYETTALMIASRAGHISHIELLIKNGAKLNFISDSDETALTMADSIDVLKFLLENGADINLKDRKGRTALMDTAWKYIGPERLEFLLNQGARINETDNNGLTALMLAAQEENLSSVETLLKNGADTKIKSKKGQTALMIAEEKGFKKIIKVLKKHEEK